MDLEKLAFLILIILLSKNARVQAQDPTTTEPEPTEPEPTTTTEPGATTEPESTTEPEPTTEPGPAESFQIQFIEPNSHSDLVDSFIYKEKEYLFINYKMAYNLAKVTCAHKFKGRLAWIPDVEMADFFAEALSETNMVLDTLWVGGRRKDTQTPWEWMNDSASKPISDNITGLISYVQQVEAHNRICLGFSRRDHQHPQFPALACSAERPLMCERPRGVRPQSNVTHPGWIKLRKRLYKIFSTEVTYDEAVSRCPQHDHKAKLAVVSNYHDAQALGRYLLIGRPSLENAWIGANWTDSGYEFEAEGITLSNVTDASTRYPPWRNEKIEKGNGCVLLDRHLKNITLFVEARCIRARSYICYKMDEDDRNVLHFTDVIHKNEGYRLVFNKLPWKAAYDFCIERYGKYNSMLVEVDTKQKVYDVLYVMGENKTVVQHLWIGAKLKGKHYHWVNSSKEVDRNLLNFIQNTTYTHSVEANNVCLNFDRENHVVHLVYGTDCTEPQAYVCHFAARNLEQLQEDEEAEENRLPKIVHVGK